MGRGRTCAARAALRYNRIMQSRAGGAGRRLALVVLAVLCASCHGKYNFELRAATLPGTDYYDIPVTCAVPDMMAIRLGAPYETAGKPRDIAMVQWRDQPAGVVAAGALRIPAGQYPQLVLGLDSAILRDLVPSPEDPKARVHIYALLEKSKETYITPAGVADIPAARKVAYGPAEYSPERGFTFLDWEEDMTVTAYTGKESVAEADRIREVIALGRGFQGGHLTQLAVTRDGKVARFDQEQRKFVEVPELAWLGAISKEVALDKPLKFPQSFCFARHLAVLSVHEAHLLVSDSGSRRQLRHYYDLEMVTPFGNWRNRDMIRYNLSHPLALKEEGGVAPEEIISDRTRAFPLNDEAIALMDPIYQRVVVVTVQQ